MLCCKLNAATTASPRSRNGERHGFLGIKRLVMACRRSRQAHGEDEALAEPVFGHQQHRVLGHPRRSDTTKSASEPDPKQPEHTNRLAGTSRPYLLQHAQNPVEWYPWGPGITRRNALNSCSASVARPSDVLTQAARTNESDHEYCLWSPDCSAITNCS